jgi:hypothetical protein
MGEVGVRLGGLGGQGRSICGVRVTTVGKGTPRGKDSMHVRDCIESISRVCTEEEREGN